MSQCLPGQETKIQKLMYLPQAKNLLTNSSKTMLNLYATYARNGTINVLLPFTDLLHNVRPYVARPASFSSHLQLQS